MSENTQDTTYSQQHNADTQHTVPLDIRITAKEAAVIARVAMENMHGKGWIFRSGTRARLAQALVGLTPAEGVAVADGILEANGWPLPNHVDSCGELSPGSDLNQ